MQGRYDLGVLIPMTGSTITTQTVDIWTSTTRTLTVGDTIALSYYDPYGKDLEATTFKTLTSGDLTKTGFTALLNTYPHITATEEGSGIRVIMKAGTPAWHATNIYHTDVESVANGVSLTDLQKLKKGDHIRRPGFRPQTAASLWAIYVKEHMEEVAAVCQEVETVRKELFEKNWMADIDLTPFPTIVYGSPWD
jgi:hypothetical protein